MSSEKTTERTDGAVLKKREEEIDARSPIPRKVKNKEQKGRDKVRTEGRSR